LGCSHSNEPAATAPPMAKAQLVRAEAAQSPQTIATAGTVHAKETAIISAQLPARIREVLVRAGDSVHAGQIVVTLDDAAMRSALGQANAAETAAQMQEMAARSEAALAATTLARYRTLQEQKSVSPQEYDEMANRSEAAQMRADALQAQTVAAKAAIAGARAQLDYTTLHAPFGGMVTARLADPGTLAAPGVPLIQLDRDGPLQLDTTVDESLIGSVRLGKKIPVSVDGAGSSSLIGTVAEIVPAADPASRSFLVKLDLPITRNLRAGMYATANFPAGTKPAILAPRSAVTLRGSLACAYVLDAGGIAQLRYITLGGRDGDNVEVLSGLAAGETMVNNPGDRDLAGKRIEAQP
ncbi:MAG: efflux RND transporter periplasmic adaptor subunit, partial [Acidobacteriaceae bacterium]